MGKLTESEIAEIQQVYAEVGNYAETARRLKRSAATVKKYVTGITPTAKEKTTKLIYFDELKKSLEKDIKPLPIEEIKIPESFDSWTTLTYEECEAMNLGEIRKERK